jgi:predicted O-methyltransferase YrrM
MIPYIGDISEYDALLLKKMAQADDIKSILEFGCGASTQVIAAYTNAKFISIDTADEWIDKTISNINLLEIKNMPLFYKYDDFDFSTGNYDFVFNDGIDSLRNNFAYNIWSRINVAGILAFHDTRRNGDITMMMNFIINNIAEIEAVFFNYNESNISLIYKGLVKPYYDWQEKEGRMKWQNGNQEPDIAYIKAELRKNGQEMDN